jgi:hypothetical protein
MNKVDPHLVQTFRELVTGKAAWPLFLFGDVGTGKSRAALCLCDCVRSSSYYTLDEICDAEMGRDFEQKVRIWRAIGTCPTMVNALVVLDELGERQTVGDLQTTVLKKCLDLREQAADRVAIYISNVAPDALARLYGDRIASRLLCGTLARLSGADRRQVDADADVVPMRKDSA